jgi:hypothetical protein
MQQIAQQEQPLTTGSIHSINELHPERRISYSTADEENSPRGSHDLISEDQQPLAGGILDKSGKGGCQMWMKKTLICELRLRLEFWFIQAHQSIF